MFLRLEGTTVRSDDDVGKDGVGDGSGFDRGAYVVDSEDVGTAEDGSYVGGGGGVETGGVGGGGGVAKWVGCGGLLEEGFGEEALAGGSGEDGQAELVELVEEGVDDVVIVAELAEAEAGVEDDVVAGGASGAGGIDAVAKAGKDGGHDKHRVKRWEGVPVLRGSAGVHEDDAAAEVGASAGHAEVPEVAGDVVDDFGTGFDGETGGFGVESIDGEDGVGASVEDGFEDWEDAGLLFGGGDGGGVGAGGFAAQVEDVGTFVEELKGVGQGFGGGEEVAAIGEAVGGDVEDAHDAGAWAKREGAGAEVPVKGRAWDEGHGEILEAVGRW